MKKLIKIAVRFLCLIVITTSWVSVAQAQTILEDQFQFNFLALNPAFAGARETFSLNAMLGNQFNGRLRPQQVYQLFSSDGAIQQGRGGLGLQAFNSNASGFTNTGVKASYAYRKQVGDLFLVALGADAGFIYQPALLAGVGLKQIYPYAGFGGLLNAERFYLSLSKPVLFIDDEGLFSSKKPFYTMVGTSLGDFENKMINVSALIESNKEVGNNYAFNAKLWLHDKFGLGLSLRSQKSDAFRTNRIIPMAEIQFSPAIRLGVSYDPKPPTFRSQGLQSSFQQSGILQIFLRYEGSKENQKISRLKYY